MMKNYKGKITAILLSILLIIVLLPHSYAKAAGSITLTVSASNTNIQVGDDVTFTVRMSDAASSDFCSFSFRISLPSGLAYIPGSGSLVPGFLGATGLAMSAFDEDPNLMASGFGDVPYNGGPLDVAVFTCTALTSGQKTVSLSDVRMYDSYVKAIPNSVVQVSIIVSPESRAGEEIPSQQVPRVESPSIENPAIESPGFGSPAIENPTLENPVIESPTLESPAIESPSMGNPALENPISNSPALGNPVAWSNPFSDISSNVWYYGDVAWAHSNGLMSGTGANRFDPQIPMSRAMLVTVIYRLAGSPSYTSSAVFSDVAGGVWYSDAVAWASANGIVNGISVTRFAPNDNITREQISAILFRYASFAKANTVMREDVSSFSDAGQISGYAMDAMSWAVASNIITGRPGGVLDPRAPATRAEVAAMLHRYAGE